MIYMLHITTVALSISGFILRGILLFSGSALIRQKFFRIVPHIVDTLLLASAITLAFQRGHNPAEQPWLAMKMVGILVYIGLGLVAFRFGKTRNQRMLAWLGAIIVFAYIVGLAITKQVFLGL